MSESGSKEQVPSAVQSPRKPLEADLDGVHYELRRETTGGEFIEIREESVVEKDGLTRLDPSRYEHANLRVRITREGEGLSDEAILALPRTHYQALSTLAVQLDNEESGIASDFLSPLLKAFPAYRSALEKLSSSRRSGSGRTSKSGDDGKKE